MDAYPEFHVQFSTDERNWRVHMVLPNGKSVKLFAEYQNVTLSELREQTAGCVWKDKP